MAILPDVVFETYVSIDQAPVTIELLEPDRRVQVMIGTPNGGYLILCMSNPAFIATMARSIADAGIGLAFLVATADADLPRVCSAPPTDGTKDRPLNVVPLASFSCRRQPSSNDPWEDTMRQFE